MVNAVINVRLIAHNSHYSECAKQMKRTEHRACLYRNIRRFVSWQRTTKRNKIFTWKYFKHLKLFQWNRWAHAHVPYWIINEWMPLIIFLFSSFPVFLLANKRKHLYVSILLFVSFARHCQYWVSGEWSVFPTP